MSKRGRDNALAAGRKRLEEWGIGAGAGVDELRTLIGRDPDADLAIAERLGSIPAPESLALLEELEGRAQSKLLRREIQRSRFRLEQRGLAVARKAKATPRPERREPVFSARLTFFGLNDQRAALLIRETLGNTEGAMAVFTPDCIESLYALRGSRQRLERVYAEFTSEEHWKPFQADWQYVDFLLCRAERAGQARGVFPTESYLALHREWVGNEIPEHVPCPIYQLLDTAALRGNTRLLSASAELVEEDAVRPFLVDEAWPLFAEKLIELERSPIVLTPAQIEERARPVREEAVDAAFGGANRERWIYRLENLAYGFFQLGRREPAEMSLAIALALRDDPHAHRQIPFCRVFAERALEMHKELARTRQRLAEKERLVVTPTSPVLPPNPPRRG